MAATKCRAKESDHALVLLNDAKALEAAGAFAIVLEAIPAELAKTITEQLTIPTIGIGAGPHCDGQVLVLYDLLGLFDDFVPKFVKPYAHLKADALQALRRYKEEVEQGKFPSDSESTTNRLLKKPPNLVLGSKESSMGTRPLHQLVGAHRLGAPYSSHRAPQRVRLRFLLACGLAMGKASISAHAGWEGEMADTFE